MRSAGVLLVADNVLQRLAAASPTRPVSACPARARPAPAAASRRSVAGSALEQPSRAVTAFRRRQLPERLRWRPCARAAFSFASAAKLGDARRRDPAFSADRDQRQPAGARLRLARAGRRCVVQFLALAQSRHLPGRKSFRFVEHLVAHFRRHVGLQHARASSLPASLSSDVARMSTMRRALGRWQRFIASDAVPSFGIIAGGRSSQTRSATFRSSFGKLLVEVGEDDLAPLLVVLPDRDADGCEIEAVLAVVVLGQLDRCGRFRLPGSTFAQAEQEFPSPPRSRSASFRFIAKGQQRSARDRVRTANAD